MRVRKGLHFMVAIVALAALLLGACAPAAAPTPVPTSPSAPRPTLAPAPPTPTTAAAPKESQPKYGGVLKTIKNIDPINYDLHQNSTITILDPLAPVYDGLVQFDPLDPNKIIPDLAERWELSPDGMTYTFYLAKGVKWHDGQPFTAADVKVSLERIKTPPKGAVKIWDIYLEGVKEFRVVDDYTIKLIMSKPDNFVVPHLGVSFLAIYPKHVLEKQGDMKKVAIGTGPYKFQDHLKGVSFSVVRNPDYFVKGRPYLDGITTYIIPDAASRLASLRTRGVDLILTYPGLAVSERGVLAKEESPLVVQSSPGLGFRSSLFNFKRKPWDDPRVRRAVSLAADRQAMLKVAEQGDGAPGAALPPGAWGIPDEELKQMPGYRYPKDADVAEAKKLLAEAGFPDGFDVTFVTRNESVYVNNAVALQNEVRKIGIRAKVQPLERAASYAAQQKGDFDVYSGSSSLRLDDPSELGPQYVTDGGKNYGFYSNPKIDSLYDQLLAIIDAAKQRAIALEMQKILLEDNPQIVHYWKNDNVAFWPYVKNYQIGGMYTNNRMRDVWLDK